MWGISQADKAIVPRIRYRRHLARDIRWALARRQRSGQLGAGISTCFRGKPIDGPALW
jgi:hypothetical protein